MRDKIEDPSMAKVRDLFEKSGLSLHELGLKMGYPTESARQAVHQFMRAGDPRISMLRKFTAALGIRLEDVTGRSQKRK